VVRQLAGDGLSIAVASLFDQAEQAFGGADVVARADGG